MRLLANPIVLKMVIAAISVLAGLVIFVLIMRVLRKSLTEEEPTKSVEGSKRHDLDLTLATYQSVIQQFKKQGEELKRLRQTEQQRAAHTENVSDAVISNLTSGVILFGPTGIVKQANAAAKAILGYASPFGLHARDLFRGALSVK